MKVCIAEKPSVAKEIASIIGANNRQDGYYGGNGYCVTWTFGHLCSLKEPHEYAPEWKSWNINALPMIPPKFGIKLINDKGVEKQFATIAKLIASADTVINCGDAGQEGELIQRWVMQLAGCKCKVERLWISSLTEESIREGFSSLKPQEEFDKLYEAGLTRAIGDWLLGINATRLYTVKYGQNRQVLSVSSSSASTNTSSGFIRPNAPPFPRSIESPPKRLTISISSFSGSIHTTLQPFLRDVLSSNFAAVDLPEPDVPSITILALFLLCSFLIWNKN